MPTEITDLDELVPAPKKVRLKGTVYTLPAELPVELFLRLKAAEGAAEEEGEDGDRIEELNELVLDLFREHQPDLNALPIGIVQLFRVIPTLYGAAQVEEDEGDADPNPSSTRGRGKPSTRSTKTRKSASSS